LPLVNTKQLEGALDIKEQEFAQNWLRISSDNPVVAPVIPILPSSAFMCALTDLKGDIWWQDERFARFIDAHSIELRAISEAMNCAKPLVRYGLDCHGSSVILIYARLKAVVNWPISIPTSLKGDAQSTKIAVIAFSLSHLDDGLIEVAKAFGMTNHEAKITAALARFGNLRQAADFAGITYNTARSSIKAALEKADCVKQAQLIAKISQIASLTRFTHVAAEKILMDVFSLNLREAKLAMLVTQGRTRNEAASLIGISEAAAKDAFERIFYVLNVKNANEIGRILTEALAASVLVDSNDIESPSPHAKSEPLRLLSRGNGEHIAISDYGPKNGAPIIFIHGSGTTRQAPRSLVAALQKAKYRPIAIDRPGFGLTDKFSIDGDAFSNAAHDMAHVCKHLGIDKVDLFARGGAQIALRFSHLYPKMVGKVAVINPSNQCGDSAKMPGLLGMIMRKLFLNPNNIEAMAKWLGAHCSPSSLEYLLKLSMRSSPPDLAVFEDERELEDYLYCSMMFVTGRVDGFANEHKLYAKPLNPEPLSDAGNWIVFNGSFDPLQNPKSTQPYWSPLLPNAKFVTYDNGGHFIHLSHTEEILAEFDKIHQL